LFLKDTDENGLPRINNGNYDLAQDKLNKENTVKPGPWTKPKKASSTIIKPVSTVNFEGEFFILIINKLIILCNVHGFST